MHNTFDTSLEIHKFMQCHLYSYIIFRLMHETNRIAMVQFDIFYGWCPFRPLSIIAVHNLLSFIALKCCLGYLS